MQLKGRRDGHWNHTDGGIGGSVHGNIPLMVVHDSNRMNQTLLSVYERAKKVSATSAIPSTEMSTNTADTATSPLDTSAVPALANAGKKRKHRGTPATTNNRSTPGTIPYTVKYPPPQTRLADLGGIESSIEEILQLIGMPLR